MSFCLVHLVFCPSRFPSRDEYMPFALQEHLTYFAGSKIVTTNRLSDYIFGEIGTGTRDHHTRKN